VRIRVIEGKLNKADRTEGKRSKWDARDSEGKRSEDKIYIRKTKVRLVREVKRIGDKKKLKQKKCLSMAGSLQSVQCTVCLGT